MIIAAISSEPPNIVAGLLLIEIGLSFGSSVGEMGQIRTLSSIVGMVTALAMGALSIRYAHRSLLLIGLTSYAVSALGCAFAPGYIPFVILYSLSGLATSMAGPMISTLIGKRFPVEKRSKAIGSVIASRSFTYLLGAPLAGYVAGVWGWRAVFLGFVLPISLISLASAARGVPPGEQPHSPDKGSVRYLEGFRKVFADRSAVACLLGATFSMVVWQAYTLYSASFFRQRFSIPRGWVSILLSGLALSFTLGSLAGGNMTERLGRKRLSAIGVAVTGVFTALFYNAPSQWLSLAAAFLGSVSFGVSYTASNSLTLEQVPRFRSTVMSVSQISYCLGSSIGAAVGGMALLGRGWGPVGVYLGGFGIASAVILFLLAEDPTKLE